jgi:hypothetical protein
MYELCSFPYVDVVYGCECDELYCVCICDELYCVWMCDELYCVWIYDDFVYVFECASKFSAMQLVNPISIKRIHIPSYSTRVGG